MIHFKQGSLHAKKVLSFMLLEQLCLAKIVRTSPCYDCKKPILFQYEFSYNRDVRREHCSESSSVLISVGLRPFK